MAFVSTIGGAFASCVALAIIRHLYKAATRSKYSAPSRISWTGYLLNWALWPAALLKRKPAHRKLTLQALQKAALQNAKGPTDFGDTWYEHAYEHACGMVNARPLGPLGQHVAFDSMQRRLLCRLRFNEELKKLPAGTLEKPMLPPVFVLGLPRTGTTFLHHLLSLDPAVRCPLTYELFDPAPRHPNDPVKDKQARIAYVASGINRLKSIVPDIEHIHEIGATEPEECLVSMGMDIPLVFATMPAYMEEKQILVDWDLTAAYRNHKKLLQLLAHQSATEDKRWVLKAPHHLGFTQYIRTVFGPHIRIVWTHRDPTASIPSLCSLFQTMIEMHQQGDVDLQAVGTTTLSFWAQMLKRADNDLSSVKADVTSHVKYEALVSDPVGTVKTLYEANGWSFTEEYELAIIKYVAKNKAEREAKKAKGSGGHAYSLERFGLASKDVKRELSWYTEKYL